MGDVVDFDKHRKRRIVIDKAINSDNETYYDALKRHVLKSWGGDSIKVTSTRKSDGATIYTVFDELGHLIIRGTLFELKERARLNDIAKRR